MSYLKVLLFSGVNCSVVLGFSENIRYYEGYEIIIIVLVMMSEEVIQIGYRSVEVKSRNYQTMLEAMGQRLYEVYKWGGGLDQAPVDLRKALLEAGMKNTIYKYGEFLNSQESRSERVMIMDKELENGVKCIYVVDVDDSRPFVYRLRNLFVKDLQGNVVDLLEELDDESKVYFSPIPNALFDPISGKLVLGDIDMISKVLGVRVGVEIYLHEIGHKKDYDVNREYIQDTYMDSRFERVLLVALQFFEGVLGTMRYSNRKFIRKMLEVVEGWGRRLIVIEENANNFVRYFIVNKREKGIDVAPDREGATFNIPLQRAGMSYELALYGIAEWKDDVLAEYRERGSELFSRKEILAILKVYRGLRSLKIGKPKAFAFA